VYVDVVGLYEIDTFKMATTNIYVLELWGGRYYVGKTDDPTSRFKQHLNGSGTAWTRKYKPLRIIKIYKNASHFDEDKVTKEYMVKYGRDKVRGGSYSNIELDDFQNQALDMEIRGATDKCSRCGRSGHFMNNCYARTDVDGNSLEEEEEEEEETGKCYRCGRFGHYANNCYARTSVW
jgi:cellular nucleic acid-binding protein